MPALKWVVLALLLGATGFYFWNYAQAHRETGRAGRIAAVIAFFLLLLEFWLLWPGLAEVFWP